MSNFFADRLDSIVKSMAKRPGGVRGTSAERTVARILDATREVFLTRGYAGTTIDEISRVADIRGRRSTRTSRPTARCWSRWSAEAADLAEG